MFGHNGTSSHSHSTKVLEAQLDSIKHSLKKLAAKISGEPEPTRMRALAGKATDLVKAYPLVAAGAALGLGYLVVRIARR